MTKRYYSSIAQPMSLTNPILATDLSMLVNTVAGLPPTCPFTLIVSPGLATEEVITVTALGGLTLTVIRHEDGSAAQPHGVGAEVRHMVTARDLRDSQDHIYATAGVHGTDPSSSLVGTTDAQVLTHKSISGLDNTFSAIPQSAIVDLGTYEASAAAATALVQTHLNTETADRITNVAAVQANVAAEAASRVVVETALGAADAGMDVRLNTLEALELPVMFGAGSNLNPKTATPLLSEMQLKIQAGTSVGTTDPTGFLGINYPTPFPNGILSVYICGGDSNANADTFFKLGWQAGFDPYPLHRFVYGAYTANGTLRTNYLGRVNWIAIGW